MDAEWHDVADASGFADGELRAVQAAGEDICVGRRAGDFFALNDICPHAGGSLSEGILDGKWVVCPLHAYAFDCESGTCPDDPRCSVTSYPARVVEGRLQIRVAGDCPASETRR